MDQSCLFGPRFLEKFVGKHILRDPKVAIVELVANAWDAGSKEVKITWPTKNNEQFFIIEDDGIGLTEEQFLSRWRTLAYDRLAAQGDSIIVNDKKRTVFGRNGIGRFAGFCFADSYFVTSTKDKNTFTYEVKIGNGDTPFSLIKVPSSDISNPKKSGTRVFVKEPSSFRVSSDEISAEIGMRFLTDPSFSCLINGEKVNFCHIPETNISKEEITLNSGNQITIQIIDTNESDKSTKQHGIAWHVNGRLVGEANWKDYGFSEIIDGRSSEARKHTFIITADFLATNSVKHDWTGFSETTLFIEAKEAVFSFVKKHMLGQTKQKRNKVLKLATSANKDILANLTPERIEKWEFFVGEIQEECLSIKENDLIKLAGILATMEQSDSKYSLINKLHKFEAHQIDDLHNILSDWTLDLAKEVLDELQVRLKLLNELKERVLNPNTLEVRDLQPLFHQGLWIFGPEYETIEFTSNEGMTRVIQKLFKSNETASRNRPDFAIIPDSTVGTYSYPTYDSDGGEVGVDRLVVVELKKPGVTLSTEEKAQCWKYVSELMKKGQISRDTKVTCFVLGSVIDPFEKDARKENNERCVIQPMTYDVVINRAKSRLLKLYERVKGAPFLEAQRDELESLEVQQTLEMTD